MVGFRVQKLLTRGFLRHRSWSACVGSSCLFHLSLEEPRKTIQQLPVTETTSFRRWPWDSSCPHLQLIRVPK